MSVWPHLLAFDLTLKKGWARGLFMRGLYKVLNRELKFFSHPEENVFFASSAQLHIKAELLSDELALKCQHMRRENKSFQA